jgi:alcohol dehydrogenase class IV
MLFGTEAEAWEVIAQRLERVANDFRSAANKAAAMHVASVVAACARNESTDCPDAHLCRHGIDG